MNAIKGEFTYTIGDKYYNFKTGTNQTAIFESVSGCSLVEYANMFAEPDKIKLTNIRALIYSCLVAAKNEITLDEVGDLIDQLPDLNDLLQKIAGVQQIDAKKKK